GPSASQRHGKAKGQWSRPLIRLRSGVLPELFHRNHDRNHDRGFQQNVVFEILQKRRKRLIEARTQCLTELLVVLTSGTPAMRISATILAKSSTSNRRALTRWV